MRIPRPLADLISSTDAGPAPPAGAAPAPPVVDAPAPPVVPAPAPTERRANTRYVFEAFVTLDSETCFTEACAGDISSGGIFVGTMAPPAVGDNVRVRVRLDLPGEPVLSLDGRVAWHRTNEVDEPIGCGIAFEDNDPEALELLDRLVARLGREPLLTDF